MKAIEQRLQALEIAAPSKPMRQFIGYESENRYYENGGSPVDYRSGINNEPEAGHAYTKADLTELERQGYQVTVISIVYEDKPLDGQTWLI